MFTKIASCFLCSLLLLAADRPADSQDKKGPADLQGAWMLVSLEHRGESFDLGKSQPRWIIKGTKVRYGGADIATFTTDPTTTPKIIDLSFLDPTKKCEGVYSLEKDTLKICVNARSDSVNERPQDFSTEGKEHLRLLVFKRDKRNVENETEGTSGYVGTALRKDQEPDQIVVAEVIDGSPAKKGGLQKNDVVLKVNGVEVSDLRPAIDLVRQAKPGQEIVFQVKRDGKEKDVKIKAGVLPWKWLMQLE